MHVDTRGYTPKRGCTMDATRKCGCTMDTRGYTWIHLDARGYTVDEPRKCWINRDEGHTRSRAPERRANNEAGARGVGGARHGVRAHARAPARALLPWAAAERQQQAARPCLTRQHGRGVPSLARRRATGGGRSSGAARGRNNETRSHTHRRARRIQMPLLLCGGKSHQRATLITRGARDARASPAAIHAGVAGAERQAARCRLPS